MIERRYSQLIAIPTYKERFQYLQLKGTVGADTFGFDRYLNQMFYRSQEWRQIRDLVIARDMGCDMAFRGMQIPQGKLIVHHMNPLAPSDIKQSTSRLLDPNQLVCVSLATHNAVHYGSGLYVMQQGIIQRKPNDTCPWK